MTQNNIFMEDENSVIYVDVLPDIHDTVTSAAATASACAISASTSAETASGLLESIRNIKNGAEVFVAQALENLRDLNSNITTAVSSLYDTAIQNINTLYNLTIQRIQQTEKDVLSKIQNLGNEYVNDAKFYAQSAQEIVDFHVSTEHLNQSKALETGDLSDDSVVLQCIGKYTHSSYCGDQLSGASPFDSKKFIKNGSLTITSDGTASGFSSSNYVTFSQNLYGNILKIRIGFNLKNVSSEQDLINSSYVGVKITNSSFVSFTISDGVNSKIITTSETALTTNTDYIAELIYNTKTYTSTINLYNSDYMLVDTETGVNTDNIAIPDSSETIILGYYSNALNGSVDLKQISITVNGVPVFSGNKTGVDTIKGNGFTTVGTPVISDDGILTATTTNQNNYVLSSSITGSDVDKIILRFKGTNKPTSSVQLNSGVVYSTAYTDGSIGFFITTTDGNKNLSFGVPSSLWGEWVDLLWEKTPGGYRAGYKLATGSTYTYSNEYTTSYSLSTGQMSLGRFTDGVSSAGQFDLNCCKVYSATGLIWQGCLRIPYTKSKTGSKIADSRFRERVSDMAEQLGYAPYYTIDETNRNFTLPKGDLYGMIEILRQQIDSLSN